MYYQRPRTRLSHIGAAQADLQTGPGDRARRSTIQAQGRAENAGIRLTAEELERFCTSILCAAGTPVAEGQVVARHLVTAELRGQSSHGVIRLRTYAKRLQAGLIRAGALLTTISETAGTIVFDGGSGFGHVVGMHAMKASVERARSTGIAAAGVRNSTHFGLAGVFALQAVEAGMIGIVCSNAAARMPPTGSKTAVLGTNPLAIAAPTSGRFPILLDMATSTAALGKVLSARDRGESIPEGWALAADGTPTTDPEAAIQGVLLPMAGPKGFGLALALEILAAVLTGAAVGRRAGSMYNTWDRSEGLGHMFIAVSTEAFMAREVFLERMDELTAQVRGAEPLSSGTRVYLPGEIEFLREAEGRERGLLMSVAQVEQLTQLAQDVGVPDARLPSSSPKARG